MSLPVTLTWPEVVHAVLTGARRHYESTRKGSQPAHGFTGDSLSIHIDGAAAEMACAKALGLYWSAPVNTYKDADLGEDIQVRLRRETGRQLIVRPSDSDEHRYVHVTGTIPDFTVHGWIYGKDAKRDEWSQEYGGRPPAYFVPDEALEGL